MVLKALCSIYSLWSLWTVLQVSLNKGPGRVGLFGNVFNVCVPVDVLWMVTPMYLVVSTIFPIHVHVYHNMGGGWFSLLVTRIETGIHWDETSFASQILIWVSCSCLPEVVSSQLHFGSFCIIHSHLQIDELWMTVRIPGGCLYRGGTWVAQVHWPEELLTGQVLCVMTSHPPLLTGFWSLEIP